MVDNELTHKGIFTLPNEILLNIFDISSTRELLPFIPTCRHFHSLILRLIHHRLQIAAGLNHHILFLECHHPEDRMLSTPLYCIPLGTQGLDGLLSDIQDEDQCVGQIRRLGNLFTRFRPESNEPAFTAKQRHPAGDVPGSRTYQDTIIRLSGREPDNVVRDIVNVDAQELFSQMTTVAYLGKRETARGLLCSLQQIADGTIRVWRDWLSRHCESRSFTDDSTVVIHQHNGNIDKSEPQPDSATASRHPTKDPRVLWINTRGEDVGIKFKVKRQKQRATNSALLYSSDIEIAVSYVIEFEEIYVRTTHLLLKLEEAQSQLSNDTGKAIVFGTFVNTA